jgi:hypothetical protein
MAGTETFRVRLDNAARNPAGDLRLGDLVQKTDLKQLLDSAESSAAYRNARGKYEFRIKESGGDVFLELKRRSTGLFGKLTGFVRAPVRQAERNAAIVSLAKFNDVWQAEANRKLFSSAGYKATTKATARAFQADLVGRIKQEEAAEAVTAEVKRQNAVAWMAIQAGGIDEMIMAAGRRAGVDADRAGLGKNDFIARLGIVVGDLTERVLEPAELNNLLDRRLDDLMQRQKVKLEEIAKLGIADPIEAELVTTALLASGKSMPPAYFDQARQAAEGLVNALERFGSLASPEERRTAAVEIVTAYQAHVAAAGNSGGQEILDFGILVAGIASSSAGAELPSLNDTVAEVLGLAQEFKFGDDDILCGAGASALYPLAGMSESIGRAAGPKEAGVV